MRRGENKTSDKGNMPLVTLGIISYNQEGYIEECFRSALAQDYPNLQIVLCDDHSTDHTLSIVERIVAEANSQHEIVIHQNAENLGIGGNVNAVFESATGELIVMMGGDDISYPNRCSVMAREWVNRGKPSGIISMFELIDDEGYLVRNNLALTSARRLNFEFSKNLVDVESMLMLHTELHSAPVPGVMGCSSCWSRDLFDFFGPIHQEASHEDVVYTFRGIISSGMSMVDEILVKYRSHRGSYTRKGKANLRHARATKGIWRTFQQMQKDLERAKVRHRYVDQNDVLKVYLEKRLEPIEFEANYFIQPLWKSLIQTKKLKKYGLGFRKVWVRIVLAIETCKF